MNTLGLKQLVDYMVTGIEQGLNICLFMGAGAARDSSLKSDVQLPSGEEVIEKIIHASGMSSVDQLRNQLGLNQKDPLTPEVAWKAVEQKPYGTKLDILNELFEIKNGIHIPVPSSYRYIAKLVLSQNKKEKFSIFTTNFDEKIEKAFRQVYYPEKGAVVTVASNEDYKNVRNIDAGLFEGGGNHVFIYKLHGTLSRLHTIPSTGKKQLDKPKNEVLTDVLNKASIILFIGYSGKDHDIRNFFKKFLKEDISNEQTKQRKICWALHSDESSLNSFENLAKNSFKKYGWDWVTYHNIDSHEFFRGLWRELKEKPRKFLKFPNMLEIDKEFCTNLCVSNKIKDPGAIFDPIYGKVILPRELWKVIDCGAIQRLRNIKQLSLAYYIYPGATHTRFAHSIGVAHLMNRLLKRLHVDKDNDITFDCTLAALLHDLGHGPFSHALDMFTKKLDVPNKDHEYFTNLFVDNGLLDIEKALNKITLNKDRLMYILGGKEHENDNNLFVYRMLLDSKGFDIDRLDFILRDLYYSGYMEKGLEEFVSPDTRNDFLDILLNNILLSKYENLPDECRDRYPQDCRIISFSKSKEVVNALKAYFKLYAIMYDQVYYKGVNRVAQAMITKALYFAFEIGELELEDIHSFTDPELFAHLENSYDKRVRDLAICVKYRYLFADYFIGDEISIDMIDKINRVESSLKDEFGVKEQSIDDMIILDITPSKGIDDFVYLAKNSQSRLEIFKPHESLGKQYTRINKCKAYLAVPQALNNKVNDMIEYLKKELVC